MLSVFASSDTSLRDSFVNTFRFEHVQDTHFASVFRKTNRIFIAFNTPINSDWSVFDLMIPVICCAMIPQEQNRQRIKNRILLLISYIFKVNKTEKYHKYDVKLFIFHHE